MAADQLEATIRELELRLMTPRIRNDSTLAGALLADEFVEFGSSGQIYDKRAVLETLANDPTPAPEVEAFSCRRIAEKVVLATYRTVGRAKSGTPSSQSLRSSLWRESDGRWQLVFHQGTSVPI